MSSINLKNISEYIDELEKQMFPLYQQSLLEMQELLINELGKKDLPPANFMSGLINGMANASFQLAVKLSFLLAVAINDPDFNPSDVETLKNLQKDLLN